MSIDGLSVICRHCAKRFIYLCTYVEQAVPLLFFGVLLWLFFNWDHIPNNYEDKDKPTWELVNGTWETPNAASCRQRLGGIVPFCVCVGTFLVTSWLSVMLDPEWGWATSAETRTRQNKERQVKPTFWCCPF